MTAQFIWTNDASSTLAAPISSTATSVTVVTGQGSLFPSPAASEQFGLTFNDAATGLLTEIAYCTARSGDTLTIVRGQEGTVAQSWNAGDLCANLITAGMLDTFVQQVAYQPARIQTASGAFTINQLTDYAIGFNRTTSLAASSGTLPNNPSQGQVFCFEDLAGNAQQYPISLIPAVGFSIANLPGDLVINDNRGWAQLRYYGSNIWSATASGS